MTFFTMTPEPNFSADDILKSPLDPVLRREVADAAGTGEWQAEAPLDLRALPLTEWPKAVGCQVLLPADVANYLAGTEPGQRLTTDEIDAVESRLDQFYEVAPPYTILLSGRTAYLQRP